MKKFMFTALFLLGWAIPSQALQIGETLLVEWLYPNSGQVYESKTIVVSSTGEAISFGGAVIIVEIDALTFNPQIIFDFTASGTFYAGSTNTFNGFRITDFLGEMPSFTSVTINYNLPAETQTNMVNFTNTNLTFTEESIYVNFIGLSFNSETIVALNIEQASAVPEPGTLVLLGAGLLGLGVLRRRKRNDLA